MSDNEKEENGKDKKQKFRVVDRRRFDSDDVEASDAPVEEKKAEKPKPEAEAKGPEKPKSQGDGKVADGKAEQEKHEPHEDPFGYVNILISFIQTIGAMSWAGFGIVPNPKLNIIARDEKESKKIAELYDYLALEIAKVMPKDVAEEIGSKLYFRNLIVSFLQTLANFTWVHLGLIPNPSTQLVAKNLEEARRMINLYEGMLNMARPELPKEYNVELDRLLADLKANYIGQI